MLVGVRGRCIPSYAGGYLAQEMNGVDIAMVKRVSEGESGQFLIPHLLTIPLFIFACLKGILILLVA